MNKQTAYGRKEMCKVKTSKVAQLCKASRDIVLVSKDDGGKRPAQWGGDGPSALPSYGDADDEQGADLRFV